MLRWREEPGADRSTTRRTPGASIRAICATVLAASLWLSLESTTMRLRGRRDWESISGKGKPQGLHPVSGGNDDIEIQNPYLTVFK